MLCVPFPRTSFARRSFSTAAPLTWNSLSPAVLNCDSLSLLSNQDLKLICFLPLSANYSTYLFRQRLCSRITALWCYINFVLLLLLLLLLLKVGPGKLPHTYGGEITRRVWQVVGDGAVTRRRRLVFSKRSAAVHVLLHLPTKALGVPPSTAKDRPLLGWTDRETGARHGELDDEQQE